MHQKGARGDFCGSSEHDLTGPRSNGSDLTLHPETEKIFLNSEKSEPYYRLG